MKWPPKTILEKIPFVLRMSSFIKSFMGNKRRESQWGTHNRYEMQKYPRERPPHYHSWKEACLLEMLPRMMLVPRCYYQHRLWQDSRCWDLPYTLMKTQHCYVYKPGTCSLRRAALTLCQAGINTYLICGNARHNLDTLFLLANCKNIFQRISVGSSTEGGYGNAHTERCYGNM